MNGQEIQVFDAVHTPLARGVNLVEASAGTGKTYTIGMIVLRLVVEKALLLEQILLVTFTRAATQELSDRIRARLEEARRLMADGKAAVGDDTLRAWVETIEDKRQAALRIGVALRDMDRAQIFTIHGFCQRVLQENSLHTAQLPDIELQPDISEIRMEVTEDFWRREVYGLPALSCAVLLQELPTPQQLFSSVFRGSCFFSELVPEMPSASEIGRQLEECLDNLKRWWQRDGNLVFDVLGTLVAEGKLKKTLTEGFAGWWQNLTAFLSGKDLLPPQNLYWLTDEGFAEQINKQKVRGQARDELVASLALPTSEVSAFSNACGDLVSAIRYRYARYFQEVLDHRLQERGVLSYDDLIVRLNSAVTGEGRDALCELLGGQYGAALIDEFQDTDMLQWQVFDALFGDGAHFLYLIGDPKQSIYRFRGADIHSYFMAREKAWVMYTLKRNFRSHPALVHGVNTLFSRREKPFLYSVDRLAFTRVEPACAADDRMLKEDNADRSGLYFCHLTENAGKKDGRWGGGEAASHIRHAVCAEIVRLLQHPVMVSAAEGKACSRLGPADMAILVRSNTHAEEYRKQLTALGVPAVINSRRSVFLSRESQDLYGLLCAITEPGNTGSLKYAMTLPWFGYTGTELHALWSDDVAFDEIQIRFGTYLESWRLSGVLAMLQNLLDDEEVFENLGRSEQSERRIANILHLCELLQQAETENLFGPLQLLEWFRQHIEGQEKEDELRLEKDESAVNIITMHGAKGLEFPVVFCPYLWYQRDSRQQGQPSLLYFEKGRTVLDLGSQQYDEKWEREAYEERAEGLRLLYVAITRAQSRCYLYWADVAGVRGKTCDALMSPLGYLLFPGGGCDGSSQLGEIENLASEVNGCALRIKAESGPLSCWEETGQKDNLTARCRSREDLDTTWQMTSYSALAAFGEHDGESFALSRLSTSAKEEDVLLPWAGLPAGANFGNVVHDLFERNRFADFIEHSDVMSSLDERCIYYGVEADRALLSQMLAEAVSSEILLPAGGTFALKDLAQDRCLKEMNFFYHMKRGQTEAVNHILRDDPTVLNLQGKAIAGYLTGFIDLIFQWDGVYYIADYKTNNLGDTVSCYRQDALVSAMASHNYGLQLWIYSLVLHNYLGRFLEGYEYEKNFGGVFYFFVRGMGKGKGVYFKRPAYKDLEQLNDCFGGADGA